jgi:protein-tyrosine-phosphatase
VTKRLLFVCTGNSARSQMAEAILNAKGNGQLAAASAGSHPAAQVNPYALATLREFGIPWSGQPPRGLDGPKRAAFRDSFLEIRRRIDLLLAQESLIVK